MNILLYFAYLFFCAITIFLDKNGAPKAYIIDIYFIVEIVMYNGNNNFM